MATDLRHSGWFGQDGLLPGERTAVLEMECPVDAARSDDPPGYAYGHVREIVGGHANQAVQIARTAAPYAYPRGVKGTTGHDLSTIRDEQLGELRLAYQSRKTPATGITT